MAVVFSPATRLQKATELIKDIEKSIEVVYKNCSYSLFKTDDVKVCQHGWWTKTEYRSRRIFAIIHLNSEKKHCNFFVYGKEFFVVAEKMAKAINGALGEDFEVELHFASQGKEYERCYMCDPVHCPF